MEEHESPLVVNKYDMPESQNHPTMKVGNSKKEDAFCSTSMLNQNASCMEISTNLFTTYIEILN